MAKLSFGGRALLPTGAGDGKLLAEVFLGFGSRVRQALLPGVFDPSAKAGTLSASEIWVLLLGGLLRWLIID